MSLRDVNVNQIPTSGASWATGNQDRLGISGVAASNQLAATDLGRVKSYKEKIMPVARRTGVDPSILAGIMSRESRGGEALDENKCGDHGNAFGLMQIDKRWHTPRGAWDSEEHISQAAETLSDMYGAMGQRFPNWSANQRMKGALAAYNMGPSSVTSYGDIDCQTTGGDYSNDVIARAQYYNQHGF